MQQNGIAAIVLAIVLLLAGTVPAPAAETPGPGPAAAADNGPKPAAYPLSAERRAQLTSYARFKNVWRFVDFFVGVAVLAVILFTGLSAKLRAWAAAARYRFLVLGLFLFLFIGVNYLLTLPFHVYSGFIVEDRYGFVNQTFLDWWKDDLIGVAVGALLALIPMWGFYALVRHSRRWWLWFSAGAAPFLVAVIVIAPIWIAPLFNDFEPLRDKALESEMLALARGAGIEGSDVFQVNGSKQSSKVNAYVTGLFDTKRIVLYDTLIDNFDLDEIRFVMGHEMGHYVMHHVWGHLAVSLAFIVAAMWLLNRSIHSVIRRFSRRFGFERLDDPASLPLVLMFVSVLGFLYNPISNGASRYWEHAADRYGMDVSGVSGGTAARAFEKLSALNLSDPDPHPLIEFWFYDHPSIKSRIAFVRQARP